VGELQALQMAPLALAVARAVQAVPAARAARAAPAARSYQMEVVSALVVPVLVVRVARELPRHRVEQCLRKRIDGEEETLAWGANENHPASRVVKKKDTCPVK
jgi:hypothetical protein